MSNYFDSLTSEERDEIRSQKSKTFYEIVFRAIEKELLEEFIDWARDCVEDAWYIFENTDEAIERFMAQRDYGDEFLGDAGS